MKLYSVSVFLTDRKYGGPEEGGWWYNTGELIKFIKVFDNEDKAIDYCRRMNYHLDWRFNRHRHPPSSVISDGHYKAEVYDGLPPNRYPSIRPHYE